MSQRENVLVFPSAGIVFPFHGDIKKPRRRSGGHRPASRFPRVATVRTDKILHNFSLPRHQNTDLINSTQDGFFRWHCHAVQNRLLSPIIPFLALKAAL